MGSVYSAYDHQRHSQVAVKLMLRASGPTIYRFKKEFRSLAGVIHPNLVTLHELIQWEDQWLFTMELVPGVPFSEVGRAATPSPPTTRIEGASVEPEPSEARPLLSDVFQVSDALRQLCDGIDYLHQLGIAHGDIKPANALITPNGRVVILDFGISRNWQSRDEDGESDAYLGTPGYIAPERSEDQPATPASDMYAVGVMLFEVLVGRRFDGEADPAAELRSHRAETPDTETGVRRREIIEDLCLRMIGREPDARPTAAEVRDAVVSKAARAERETAIQLARGRPESPFVSRAVELEAVRNAVLDKRSEAPRLVIVSGESGIGKTELMRRIIDEELPSSCLVLEGKCYEREQVPYRAMDRLIDSLSSKLLGVASDRLGALSWADLAVVSRMFPVLRPVPEIERLRSVVSDPDRRNDRERRRAAAAILIELFALVAEGRRLILYIDDLHWGDEESGSLLREILLDARGVDLRIVGCHRDPVEKSRIVDRILEGEAPLGHVELHIEGLPTEESKELVRALLGPDANAGHIARVAAEASGNPFLIRELVEFGAGMDLDELALRSAVARHVLLSEPARRVLEVLAVAGRRLDIGLTMAATGIGQTFEAAVILLQSQHLIKASDLHGEEIEPYHDRIREVIVQGLSSEARTALHGDLAEALAILDDPDPAVLGFHLKGAGESTRAAEVLLRAAQNAEASLAPLNAAGHYASVVELTREDDPRHLEALHGQARNLSAAGRGGSAGPLYMELADCAEPSEALALRRRAAEAWMSTGEFARARSALRGVLAAAGVREPKTLPGLLWSIARERLWVRLRRNRYTACPEAAVSSDRLLRADAFETAAELYGPIDLLRSFLAHASHVHEALEIGEPQRVARALIHEVVVGGIGGESSSRYGLELLRMAKEAVGPDADREMRALLQYGAGVHALLNGRYRDTVETLGEVAHAPDLEVKMQQLRTVRSVVGYSRWWLGQWRTMNREYRGWILDAVERGDHHSAYGLRVEQSAQWEAVLDDEPERAIEQVAQALASPIAQELTFEHLAAQQTRALVALYMGRAAEAERMLRFPGAQRLYLRVQRSRVEIAVLHAYAALASGPVGLRRARSWMRKIEKEGLAWAQPIARLIAASIAAREGRRDESIVALERVISLCDEQGYAMFSAAASWRLGELQGGAEGEARRTEAAQRMAEQGAKRPDRIVRTLAPGFRDSL
jgi:serine/threonine protein kinase